MGSGVDRGWVQLVPGELSRCLVVPGAGIKGASVCHDPGIPESPLPKCCLGLGSQQSVPLRVFCSPAPPSCASGTTGWFFPREREPEDTDTNSKVSSPTLQPGVPSSGCLSGRRDQSSPAQRVCKNSPLPCLSQGPLLPAPCWRSPGTRPASGTPPAPGPPSSPGAGWRSCLAKGGQRVPPGKVGDTGRAGLGPVPECYQPIGSPAAGGSALRRDRAGP